MISSDTRDRIAAIDFFLSITVFVMAIVGGLLWWLFTIGAKEDLAYQQSNQKWMEFSSVHYCKVTHYPAFLDSATTWECSSQDGKTFQIVRAPRD